MSTFILFPLLAVLYISLHSMVDFHGRGTSFKTKVNFLPAFFYHHLFLGIYLFDYLFIYFSTINCSYVVEEGTLEMEKTSTCRQC